MSAAQLHTASIDARPDQIPDETIPEQCARAARHTGERRWYGPALRRRRLAIAAAVAVGLTSGTAAIVASASTAPETIAQGSRSALSTPALHAGATEAAFVRHIRVLEARGYVDVACQVGGDLMFNPRTHGYLKVRV